MAKKYYLATVFVGIKQLTCTPDAAWYCKILLEQYLLILFSIMSQPLDLHITWAVTQNVRTILCCIYQFQEGKLNLSVLPLDTQKPEERKIGNTWRKVFPHIFPNEKLENLKEQWKNSDEIFYFLRMSTMLKLKVFILKGLSTRDGYKPGKKCG